MIRDFKLEDLKYIDEIGNCIKEKFLKKERIEEIYNLDYIHIYIFEENNIVKGFLQIENHYEITDIINIAVKEEYQHNNIGSKLMEYLLNNTKASKIMLEVNEKNINALNFYKKYNFKEINRRNKYYGENDAIIMERVM